MENTVCVFDSRVNLNCPFKLTGITGIFVICVLFCAFIFTGCVIYYSLRAAHVADLLWLICLMLPYLQLKKLFHYAMQRSERLPFPQSTERANGGGCCTTTWVGNSLFFRVCNSSNAVQLCVFALVLFHVREKLNGYSGKRHWLTQRATTANWTTAIIILL